MVVTNFEKPNMILYFNTNQDNFNNFILFTDPVYN